MTVARKLPVDDEPAGLCISVAGMYSLAAFKSQNGKEFEWNVFLVVSEGVILLLFCNTIRLSLKEL